MTTRERSRLKERERPTRPRAVGGHSRDEDAPCIMSGGNSGPHSGGFHEATERAGRVAAVATGHRLLPTTPT